MAIVSYDSVLVKSKSIFRNVYRLKSGMLYNAKNIHLTLESALEMAKDKSDYVFTIEEKVVIHTIFTGL